MKYNVKPKLFYYYVISWIRSLDENCVEVQNGIKDMSSILKNLEWSTTDKLDFLVKSHSKISKLLRDLTRVHIVDFVEDENGSISKMDTCDCPQLGMEPSTIASVLYNCPPDHVSDSNKTPFFKVDCILGRCPVSVRDDCVPELR